MKSRKSLPGTADRPEPKPCKRYAKMLLNAQFIAHLPACRDCLAVVAQLNRKSEMKLRMAREFAIPAL
jgi:hypothetical protein